MHVTRPRGELRDALFELLLSEPSRAWSPQQLHDQLCRRFGSVPKSSVASLLRTYRGTFVSSHGLGLYVVDPEQAALAAEFASSRQGRYIGPRCLVNAGVRGAA